MQHMTMQHMTPNYNSKTELLNGQHVATSGLQVLCCPRDMPGYEGMIILAEAIRQSKTREMCKYNEKNDGNIC